MNMKKSLAALLALCLMMGGLSAATAEGKLDALGDLLGSLFGQSDSATDADGDDDPDYLYDDGDEEPIVVDEHVEVTDLAVTEGLSDGDEVYVEAKATESESKGLLGGLFGGAQFNQPQGGPGGMPGGGNMPDFANGERPSFGDRSGDRPDLGGRN